MRRTTLAFTAILGFLGGVPVAHAADPVAEIAFVKALFADLQPKSFRANREYCGYVGYNRRGQLVATRARRGGEDYCEPRWPWRFDPVASYHTHGAYDPDAWSEIPSGTDMESDEAEGVDGYVATPGGRLWYIDSEAMVASQLCGVGCLTQDPDFKPETEIIIEISYSYDDLVEVFEEDRP